jgi:hypothetical protein
MGLERYSNVGLRWLTGPIGEKGAERVAALKER